MPARPHRAVIFGATGFCGDLVARWLLGRPGEPTRFALAGRSLEKLSARRRELERDYPIAAEVALIEARSDDAAALRAMAAAADVVINLVGPYRTHGEGLIEACIEAGSHYVDLTGEASWWQGVVDRFHARARSAEVAIIPSCGFESVPMDLVTRLALERLATTEKVEVRAYVRAVGGASGGTWASVLSELGRSGAFEGARASAGELHRIVLPSPSGPSRRWAVPMPTIEPRVVRRSAGLVGASVSYSQFLALGSLAQVAGLGIAVGSVAGLSKIGPARRALQKLQPQGSGPTDEKRRKSWFRVDAIARAGDRSVHTFVRGGDPGYGETSKMIAEAALALAEERPQCTGVVTPASAIGEALTRRLGAAGIEFGVEA